MGMLDQSTKLATAQTVTAIGDTVSTNVYDFGSAPTADAALTSPYLWLNAQVATTATSGGAATVQAVLQDSADNATFADVLSGPVVALAALTAGAPLLIVQPPVGLRRYFRVAWRVAGAALTGGTFSAFVSMDVQRNVSRPSGFSVA